ncbi:hypothetical protein BU24DRAFT_442022 [Aaosphaeria arxii CBS 175.79]|uniref:DUF7703 domain-containing protein n=1 Tax=Aaosphaeria arxii CBS 175.79 TaxID=1450172 RepID=A0A6A5XNL6_9PLEO|nr:uncharacterized protein BU24DRAFT_442022 [Aaosphaeria arxii CBS 175.79]KAF2014732.1 hypothetical protein BU24DRAFT_442022 [Aaosphaeria arxii CBS 175.79]
MASSTTSALPEQTASSQGNSHAAGAGITGGYTGDSLGMKIIISFLLGLGLYNALELITIILITFNKYRGIYFWSLMVAGFGIFPYALGFVVKFFHLLDPDKNIGFVAVTMISVGWWAMITGQSVVLWSRLHLVTNSRRILNWTLGMIIVDAIVLHIPTSILSFGANANDFSPEVLKTFINGYTVMEKIQMVGFFLQELILSIIYIKETIRLLRLSEAAANSDGSRTITDSRLHTRHMRKVMYQLLAINAIIIAMDIILLAVELANYYLVEVCLKAAVYSIKLKLEFAVLSRLVQLVRTKSQSGNHLSGGLSGSSQSERRGTGDAILSSSPEKIRSHTGSLARSPPISPTTVIQEYPDFVDPRYVSPDITHAEPAYFPPPEDAIESLNEAWEVESRDKWRRRSSRAQRGQNWIDQEMDKHNIG